VAGLAASFTLTAGLSARPASPRSETVALRIARFLTGARFEDLPAEVIERAKEQIIFFVGRAFEGHVSRDAAQMRRALQGYRQSGVATVIGEPFRLPVAEAAFANCTLMRGDQGKDDVLWPAGIHAGVITLPTALALAEVERRSGPELLLALVLGYEVLGKLGSVADPWTAAMPRRPTTVYGGLGPTAVAARLLKLGQVETAAALGYGANIAMGVAEGGMMPHFYSFLNSAGIRAATLAAAGATPYSPVVIEGEVGLFRSTFGEVPAALDHHVDKLGNDWEILKAEQKHYPGTGQNAVPINIFRNLRQRERLDRFKVRRIHVVLPGARDSDVRKKEIASQGPFLRQVSAYSSLPFALALVLIEGDVLDRWYAEDISLASLNDAAVATEMRKILVTFEDRPQTPRYSRVTVETVDGRRLSREVSEYKPEFPRSMWGDWLRRSAAGRVPAQQLVEIENAVRGLERLPDIANLMRATVPSRIAGE
jgi:2-methylcitrate dehydratase PrpD